MTPSELHFFLNEIYKKLPNKDPMQCLVYSPAIGVEESEFFGKGLNQGLFLIDEDGYAQSEILPQQSKSSQKQKMLCLFWRRGNRWFLFREGICQLAFASKLINKYGWSKSEITMEPGLREFGAFAYGVDILIKPYGSAFSACVELKRDRSEFEKLVKGFENCCAMNSHSKEQCPYKTNHAKWEFCNKVRPSYITFAAPNVEKTYKLSYRNDRVSYLSVLHSLDKSIVLS